ncbi:MAG: ATP-dependent protease subunit HslV [bacterium]
MFPNPSQHPTQWHGTTVLGIRRPDGVAIAADGQVTVGDIVAKSTANKLRRLSDGQVIAGFAGGVADALALFDQFERRLADHKGQLMRAAVELAKDWRQDRYLRRLEAMLLLADRETLLVVSGGGEVLEPENDIAAIGSGGAYALAAARALAAETTMGAEQIARRSLEIAADLCIYTNHNIRVETLAS